MATKAGKVEFYVGPHTVGGPDDLEKVIVDFIDGAQSRLEVAVQELESDPIARAMIAARRRKVLVKLVIEHDYLRSRAQKDPFTPSGKSERNRQSHHATLRTNIDVKSDYNSSIFHQKFIIRDRTSLLTGSTNFTPEGDPRQLESPRRRPRRARRQNLRPGVQGDPAGPLRQAQRGPRPVSQRRHGIERPRTGAVRARSQPRNGDHEADAQGPTSHRLRDLHLCQVVRHRRHDVPPA